MYFFYCELWINFVEGGAWGSRAVELRQLGLAVGAEDIGIHVFLELLFDVNVDADANLSIRQAVIVNVIVNVTAKGSLIVSVD